MEEADAPAGRAGRVTLRRSGMRPLRFFGWQLVEASGEPGAAPLWYDINIPETRAGAVLIKFLAYREAMGEPDLSRVEILASLAEAATWLDVYAPATDTGGQHPGEAGRALGPGSAAGAAVAAAPGAGR
jgi:hypothetical protein